MLASLFGGKEKKGNVTIQTEYPFYEAGNTVNGRVLIEIQEPLHAISLTIEVDASEYIHFVKYH